MEAENSSRTSRQSQNRINWTCVRCLTNLFLKTIVDGNSAVFQDNVLLSFPCSIVRNSPYLWSIFYFLQFQITSFIISHRHKEQTAPPIIHVVCKWKQNMPTHLSLFSLGKLLQYIHSEVIFFDGIYKTELLAKHSNNIALLPLKKIYIQINSLYISPTVALWIISYSFGINYRCRICWAHCNPLIFIMREGSNHGVSSSMLCFLLTI